MTDVLVRVFHNFTQPPLPFHADDQLRQVATFGITVPVGEKPHGVPALLAAVFDQLNQDMPTTAWAKFYQRRGYRALSVGDVVTIDDQAWAYEPLGWRRVTLIDDQIWVDVGHTRNGEPLLSRG